MKRLRLCIAVQQRDFDAPDRVDVKTFTAPETGAYWNPFALEFPRAFYFAPKGRGKPSGRASSDGCGMAAKPLSDRRQARLERPLEITM